MYIMYMSYICPLDPTLYFIFYISLWPAILLLFCQFTVLRVFRGVRSLISHFKKDKEDQHLHFIIFSDLHNYGRDEA